MRASAFRLMGAFSLALALAPVPSTVAIQAISDMPAGNFAVSYVTVGTVPISVGIDPAVASVTNCGRIPLTATVTADVAQAGVSWSIEGNLSDLGVRLPSPTRGRARRRCRWARRSGSEPHRFRIRAAPRRRWFRSWPGETRTPAPTIANRG